MWEVGIILSVNRLARLPLNPAIGWLYGKIRIKDGILVAAILATVTTLSYAFIKGFAFWLIARCLWGLSWTFLRLGAYFTIIEVSTAGNRGHYMGTYNGLYRLGSLAGMLAGGILVDLFSLKVTAVLFGALTFLAIPYAYWIVPNVKSKNQPNEFASLAPLANANAFWALFTGMLVAVVYPGILTATLSYITKIQYSTTLLVFGISVGAASLTGIMQASRWAWEPYLAPWIGKRSDDASGGNRKRQSILGVTMILAALLFALIPVHMPVELWLVLIIGVLLSATALTTVSDAIACDVAVCSSQKLFMTTYSFVNDLGSALGPLIAYAFYDSLGPYAVYWLIAAAFFLLSLKWLLRPIRIN